MFCKTISGNLKEKGAIFHFLEFIGWFPLYLPAQVSLIEQNRYIEYKLIFPFSLLNIGRAFFKLIPISSNKTELIAYVEAGYNGVFGKLLDTVALCFLKKADALEHMQEEGSNIKRYLEHSYAKKKV